MSSGVKVIRAAAAEWRARDLGMPCDDLIPCGRIIACCAEKTGFAPRALPAGDPLLSGATAMLDREARTIWYDAALSTDERPFVLAHEFAHLALHSECLQFNSSESGASLVDLAAAEDVVSGYSPQQRREVEANVWSAELLLPCAAIQTAFCHRKMSATEIAALVGLSRHLVYAQMRAILLDKSVYEPSVDTGSMPVHEPDLDESQRAAAIVESGPLLLSAGPGTGKTRTLAARCEHLVRERGVPAERILVLTFSRKAAENLRARLVSLSAAGSTAGPWVGTFHAFCLETLRRFGHKIDLQPGWRVIGESDAELLLEQRLAYLHRSDPDRWPYLSLRIDEILTAVARAKDELVNAEVYQSRVDDASRRDTASGEASSLLARQREVARIYALYEQTLRQAKRLDYGDLLVLTIRMLQRERDIARQLASEYPWILVDEYQDVNFASIRLLRLLAGKTARGLWVVGDRRQTIYRFRGAAQSGAEDFQSLFPGAQTMELSTNYRSAGPIVRLLNFVAGRLSAADPQPFTGWEYARPNSPSGDAPPVVYATALDSNAQVDGIASQMRSHAERGIGYGDQAVLCRTNAQARDMARALRQRGIPVQGATEWLDSAEAKDLASIVELAASAGDMNSTPAVRRISRLMCGGDRFALDGPAGLLPSDMIEAFLFEQGTYLRNLLSVGGRAASAGSLGAIRKFAEYAAEWQAAKMETAVRADPALDSAARAFLQSLRRELRQDRPQGASDAIGNADAVTVMTVHSAKGLEFRAVFIPNLSKGLFPVVARSPEMPLPSSGGERERSAAAGYDEETCLFFVALSRAKDCLVLSHAERGYDSGDRMLDPSPFLGLLVDGLKSLGVKSVRWSPPTRPSGQSFGYGVTLHVSEEERHFDGQALEIYRQCPRKYFYQYCCGYAGASILSESEEYQDALSRASAWLREEIVAGRTPTDWQIERHIGQVLQRYDYRNTIQRELDLNQIAEILRRRRGEAGMVNKPATKSALRHGWLGWMAALLRGDRQQKSAQELSHNGNYVDRRLAEAAEGIRLGRFAPTPDSPRRCRSCEFYFACPE